MTIYIRVSLAAAATIAAFHALPALAQDTGYRMSREDFDSAFESRMPIWEKATQDDCLTNAPGTTKVAFDADGQPGDETICSRVIHDAKLGAFLDVEAFAKRPTGNTQVVSAVIAGDDWDHPDMLTPTGGQPFLCDVRTAQLTRYAWNPADEHLLTDTPKPIAIKVSTQNCDDTYLFWPDDLNAPHAEFDLELDGPG